MGLNIGLYLRRSEGPIRKSEVLVRKSEVLVWTSDQEETKGICLCKQETHVEDSPIALVTPPSTPPKQKQILPKSVLNLLIYKRNTL
jgi:hypothetical protein